MTPEEKDRLKELVREADAALIRARQAQQALANYATKLTYSPCAACGRRVPSPCDSRANYQESGPWDHACKALLYPDRA